MISGRSLDADALGYVDEPTPAFSRRIVGHDPAGRPEKGAARTDAMPPLMDFEGFRRWVKIGIWTLVFFMYL